jgi:uncharacterized phage-associated protein
MVNNIMNNTNKRVLSCFDIANYFLVLVDREAGDSITQLKIQKLVYFAQGISLSLLKKPLFNEQIEAWEHGPVIRELRKTFGTLKDGPIAAPGEIDFDIYSQSDKELIYKVYSTYGEHSASYLRNLTHEHVIWQEAIRSLDKVIEQEKIKIFFEKVIPEDFLLISKEDALKIEDAEDQWWMNYDSGIPSEDVTTEALQLLKEGRCFESNLV